MTYFTRNDEEEPIPIKDGKGLCCNWCVGANLDDDDNVEKIVENRVLSQKKLEKMEKKEEKKLEKERRSSKKKASKAQKEASFVKKVFFWICGIEKQMNMENLDAADQPHEEIDTSINQNKFWAVICDINAIIAMSLVAFVFAFFNIYN